MKQNIIRTAAVAVLGILLMLALLPEKAEEERNTGIPVTVPPEEKRDIYIHVCSVDALRQRDGQYLVEVKLTLDSPGKPENMRMVTVFCGDQKRVFSLTKENFEDVHTVCFLAADQPETVRVEVRYHQTEAGLLLMSEGEGQLCGEAIAPVNGDRILLLSGGVPDASYQIYQVAELYELLSGMVVLNLKPTARELNTYAVRERYMTSLTVDEQGTACWNLTLEDVEDGVYLVTGEGEAHYVCLPQVDASGELISSVARLSLGDELQMQQNAQK